MLGMVESDYQNLIIHFMLKDFRIEFKDKPHLSKIGISSHFMSHELVENSRPIVKLQQILRTSYLQILHSLP